MSNLLLPLSDEQAMERVRAHDDPNAFSQLMQKWTQPIQHLCARMTGDPHRAEDLAQETFLRLHAHRAQYRIEGKFSTYLWRIALNLCYDELRRRQRRPESPLEPDNTIDLHPSFHHVPSEEPPPWAHLQARERIASVQQALLSLSEPLRAVVILRHYENLKFREIAEVIDIPEGTVKSRMAEALSQLEKILQPSFASTVTPQNERILL